MKRKVKKYQNSPTVKSILEKIDYIQKKLEYARSVLEAIHKANVQSHAELEASRKEFNKISLV